MTIEPSKPEELTPGKNPNPLAERRLDTLRNRFENTEPGFYKQKDRVIARKPNPNMQQNVFEAARKRYEDELMKGEQKN